MIRVRVRVSTIEKFRRLIVFDYQTQEDLIEYIRNGQNSSQTSVAMEVGTAWHKLMERPLTGYRAGDEHSPHYNAVGKFFFNPDDVRAARELVGRGRHEVTHVRPIETTHGHVFELKGTTDLILGPEVTDFKTKLGDDPGRWGRPADAQDYEHSLQWPFYLWLTGCRRFRYICFQCKGPDEQGLVLVDVPQSVSFSFDRYETLQDDVVRWCSRFWDFAEDHDLLHFLEHKE